MARTGHPHARVRFVVLWALVALVAPMVGISSSAAIPASAATQVTIDFSDAGQGPFQQDFFEADGVAITEGSFVGFIQGDAALIGPVAARLQRPAMSLSATVAPGFQGTAEYTLTALNGKDQIVASTSMEVTQDTGDPATGPFGYFTIDLGRLPRMAKAFTLSNRFVRSSFPQNTTIDFGVSSISFSLR